MTEEIEQKVLDDVVEECRRQDEKWGVQAHPPLVWVSIAVEEAGEAAKAVLENDGPGWRAELVQLAAVAIQAIKCYDKEKKVR